MTREELIEELKKIKNIEVKVRNYDDGESYIDINIWGDFFKPNFITYTDDSTLYFASSPRARFLNRTEQQVLSAVKALVE